MRRQGDGEDDNAASRNRSCAYSRLIDGEVLGVAVTVYVLVPVAVAIEIIGGGGVFVLWNWPTAS
jgi:hypothetical protein